MPQSKSVSEVRAVPGWRLQIYRIGTVLVSTLLSLFLAELALRGWESRKARRDDSVTADKMIIDPELGKGGGRFFKEGHPG